MICVIATIEVAPGQRDAFLAEFFRVVPAVLAEDGCLEYAPMLDLETTIAAQGAVRDNAVVIVEKWRDVPALETHLIAPHMLEYRERVKDLVQGVQLQVLRPAEPPQV